MHAVCTTEDAIDLNSRLLRHVDEGTAGDTFLVTTTIGGTHPSAHQVDDGSGLVRLDSTIKGILCLVTHAKTVIGTGTENLHISEIRDAIGDVDQHITVVLRLVAVTVTGKTFSCTEDALYHTVSVGDGSDINESIMQIGFIGDAVLISISLIVIVTKTAAKNTPHPTLGILHIRGNRTGFCHHCLDIVTDAVRESRTVGR